jgi:hypothetical protein
MKRYMILFVLAAVSSAYAQGPFGFEKGMTREEVIKLVGQSAIAPRGQTQNPYNLILNTAPKPHSAFEKYILTFSPKEGLLKIQAIGKDIDSDSSGTEVKTAYNDIVDGLNKKYGPPTQQFDNLTGQLFNEPNQWMMSILDKDRSVASFWNLSPPLNNVKDIMSDVNVSHTNKGYIVVRFEFTGWNKFVDSLKAAENNNF